MRAILKKYESNENWPHRYSLDSSGPRLYFGTTFKATIKVQARLIEIEKMDAIE